MASDEFGSDRQIERIAMDLFRACSRADDGPINPQDPKYQARRTEASESLSVRIGSSSDHYQIAPKTRERFGPRTVVRVHFNRKWLAKSMFLVAVLKLGALFARCVNMMVAE